MENKEKQVRKIAQRVMTKYKLHPPVDMMGLIQEKGITCVEENLGTNADGYSDLKDSDLKIVLNSAIQYEPRKRFTMAHELGHIVDTSITCGAVPGSVGRNGGLDHGCKCRRSSGVRCFAGR